MDNRQPMGKEFLAMPQPHHHVSRLLVLVVTLLVVAGLVWAYVVFFAPPQTTSPGTSAVEGEYSRQVTFSPEEALERQALFDQPNPQVELDAKERARRAELWRDAGVPQ